MISYAVLQNLEDDCFELLNATTGMIDGSNGKSMKRNNQRIAESLRKIVIANEMIGKGIICISGLQGSGKSTLMKNFYGLSDEYFNIQIGVGERIPVFISENGKCTEPEMYAVTLDKQDDGSYIRTHVKMDAASFRNASSGEQSDPIIMFLELRLPYKHLNNESYEFMLLPGFEKKNDYWKSLIDFSVKCSDTSIFVFNESSFSKYDNQELLDKIHEKFGESLIYAISQSDLSEDNNASVKNTCIEVMKIPQGQEDRVVCVGEFENEADNEKWIIELKKAIEKYCNSVEIARKNCTEYIEEIIEDELRVELENVKNALGSDEGDLLESHLENSSYLKVYDQVVVNRRKILEKQLDIALEMAFSSSRIKLERIFSEPAYAKQLGVQDNGILRRTIFGENVKDIKRARERVEAALKSENGEYGFQYAFFDAIGNATMETFNKSEYQRILIEDQNSGVIVFNRDMDAIQNTTTSLKHQNILFDVAVFLSEANRMPQLKHDNLAETMKVIAELGTEFFELSTLMESSRINRNLIVPEVINEKLEIGYDEISKKITSVEKVVLSTLGITGVDFLHDGVLNIIPKIAEGLGIAVPIVTAATAIIAVGTTGAAVIQDINRLKRTEYYSAENAINAILAKIKINYLEFYDDVMKTFRDRIEENIINVSGVNRQETKRFRAIIALNNINNDLDLIYGEVTRKSYDIGEAFRG